MTGKAPDEFKPLQFPTEPEPQLRIKGSAGLGVIIFGLGTCVLGWFAVQGELERELVCSKAEAARPICTLYRETVYGRVDDRVEARALAAEIEEVAGPGRSVTSRAFEVTVSAGNRELLKTVFLEEPPAQVVAKQVRAFVRGERTDLKVMTPGDGRARYRGILLGLLLCAALTAVSLRAWWRKASGASGSL